MLNIYILTHAVETGKKKSTAELKGLSLNVKFQANAFTEIPSFDGITKNNWRNRPIRFKVKITKGGGSLSRAILDGKISKRYEIFALAGSPYNIVNHLFTGITDDVL